MRQWILLFIMTAVLAAACDTTGYDDVYYELDSRVARGTAIASATDLAKIGIDEDYPLDGDYYLADDIDLSAHKPWAPIGTEAAPFTGVFDGNGKTVRGLTLSGGTRAHTGLFGYLLNARLFDVTIEINDTTAVLTAPNAQYAGVAAGYIKASYIDGITIRTAAGGGLYVIKAGATDFSAGGLAGRLEGSTAANITVNLDLHATAGAQLYAGLVAGYSEGGTLSSCYAEGSVDAVTATHVRAGGIVGCHTTPLENCTSATGVYAESSGTTSNTFVYAGGITGLTTSNTNTGYVGSITSSSLKADHPVLIQGKLTGISTNASTVYAGGIGGSTVSRTVDRCVVDAPDVTIIAASEGAANLYAGGIAGQSGTISNSAILRGAVRAETAAAGLSSTAVTIVAGGISGGITSSSSQITNCFSGADVTIESALKATFGSVSTAAGGIAGWMTSPNRIEYSAASGAVRVVSTSSEPGVVAVFAGGILGYSGYTGTAIEYSAALNRAVEVESLVAAPYAYRILGGLPSTNNGTTLVTPETKPSYPGVTLYSNYALPDMAVRTKKGADDWVPVPQEPNNAANLMGDDNMERTQEFFESRLGWNFNTDWYWDAAADLPFPRF